MVSCGKNAYICETYIWKYLKIHETVLQRNSILLTLTRGLCWCQQLFLWYAALLLPSVNTVDNTDLGQLWLWPCMTPEKCSFPWGIHAPRNHSSLAPEYVLQMTCLSARPVFAWLTMVASRQIHTRTFNGPFPGLPRWAGTRKVKPIWILLKQETVSGNGYSWTICKSAPHF